MHRLAALLLVALAVAGCASSDADTGQYTMTAAPDNSRTSGVGRPAPLDPTRPISERDCSNAIQPVGGNLLCR